MTVQEVVGSIEELWRYPVKSMLGESLEEVEIGSRGVTGDRAYALVDRNTEKVATAKNPRRWPRMFEFAATYTIEPRIHDGAGPLRIRLPSGGVVAVEDTAVDAVISRELERDVFLQAAAPWWSHRRVTASEAYWPDMEGLKHRDTITQFELPRGTFFDGGVIHILTSASVEQLRRAYPEGQIETPRLRPNIVVRTAPELEGFVEDGWIGGTLEIGDQVEICITRVCSRCVMTTLPQKTLRRDLGVLKTIVGQNQAHVGVYGVVVRGGIVRRGSEVKLRDL